MTHDGEFTKRPGAGGDHDDYWWQDHLLGETFRLLDQAGIADNTMVVVTADHAGKSFAPPGELEVDWRRCRRGECSTACPCSSGTIGASMHSTDVMLTTVVLRIAAAERGAQAEFTPQGRQARLTSSLVNVPLLVRLPSRLVPQRLQHVLRKNTGEVVSTTDIVPTVVDLLQWDFQAAVRGCWCGAACCPLWPFTSSPPMQPLASFPGRFPRASLHTTGSSLFRDLPHSRVLVLLNTGMFRPHASEPFAIVHNRSMLLFDAVSHQMVLVQLDSSDGRALSGHVPLYQLFNFYRADAQRNEWPRLSRQDKARWLHRAASYPYLHRILVINYVWTRQYALDGLWLWDVL